MKKGSSKEEKRARRQARIRAKVSGTSTRPRLSVYRSNRYVYAQLIDDTQSKTLAAVSSLKMKGKGVMEKAKCGLSSHLAHASNLS